MSNMRRPEIRSLVADVVHRVFDERVVWKIGSPERPSAFAHEQSDRLAFGWKGIPGGCHVCPRRRKRSRRTSGKATKHKNKGRQGKLHVPRWSKVRASPHQPSIPAEILAARLDRRSPCARSFTLWVNAMSCCGAASPVHRTHLRVATIPIGSRVAGLQVLGGTMAPALTSIGRQAILPRTHLTKTVAQGASALPPAPGRLLALTHDGCLAPPHARTAATRCETGLGLGAILRGHDPASAIDRRASAIIPASQRPETFGLRLRNASRRTLRA